MSSLAVLEHPQFPSAHVVLNHSKDVKDVILRQMKK